MLGLTSRQWQGLTIPALLIITILMSVNIATYFIPSRLLIAMFLLQLALSLIVSNGFRHGEYSIEEVYYVMLLFAVTLFTMVVAFGISVTINVTIRGLPC